MRSRPRRTLVAAFSLALLAAAAWLGWDRWVDVTELPPLTPATSVEVLAQDGRLLRAFTVGNGVWRLRVAPESVDERYLAMLLAYEDRRFYHHNGVDLVALARAAAQSLLGGRLVSGGSTLTMQVARLLEGGSTGLLAGKVRQMRVAWALERRLGKEEILALYMQLAPMGGNLEGVRAGSLAWFGKEPERLTEAQAALLVAVPQAPASRAPDLHPEASAAARERVLRRAAQLGVITEEAALAALTEALPRARQPFPALAPHLADRLRAAQPLTLVHRTSIDLDLQVALEALARSALVGLPPQATVALMVADPNSGAVLATVGSADYTSEPRRGFVDMTQALRSPGSTLKPLVYGVAFSDGMAHPETLLNDRPEDYGGYAPQNFDGVFRGQVTARYALQQSLNLPVVELTQAIGPARLLTALRQARVQAEVPGDAAGLAIALGGVGVSLEGLVQLYGAIARGGTARELSVVAGEEVAALDTGAAGTEPVPSPRLMTPEAAWQVANILATAPRPAGAPNVPLAFKTGTSHGHRDALALGFDGEHVAGVWVGRADGSPVPGMYGLDVAVPVLFELFARLGGVQPQPPAPPTLLTAASNAELPAHLQQFGSRVVQTEDSPRLTFPPEGAALAPLAGGIPVKVERGRAPFAWFANGEPVLLGSYERETRLEVPGPGFVTLSLVDAEGRSARVQVEVR
ncbi:MAG: penicillin-binding protein 1C [Trueperaceae bacterium]